MTESSTITFSRTGVQPPVYVVTSLSEPPWLTLEMHVDQAPPPSTNLIFSRRFDNVAQGDYQYKIRIGDGQWVVDDTKDTATDEHGNCNNVVHVGAAPGTHNAAHHTVSGPNEVRKDSTIDSNDMAPKRPQIADAEPDMLKSTSNNSSDHSINDDDEAAPLFRHESFQSPEITFAPVLQTMDEASTDCTSSKDATENFSLPSGSQHEEPSHEPPFAHETTYAEQDFDQLSNGPLLSHETGLKNGETHPSEDDVDELDAAPLLSHETGFSQSKGSEITNNSGYTTENVSEPRHYMYDDDDDDDDDNEGDMCYEYDTPLLPHERSQARDFATAEHSDTEEGSGFKLQNQPTFDYEDAGESAKALFDGRVRSGIFRKPSHSSTLPHKLPKTDEEDKDLVDPYLERFPTHREQILARVATIGLHLPEDEPMDNHTHSPVHSVFSQACSSVDLVPVKSYASLASVPEAADSDEEEFEAHADVESLPSPVVMSFGSASRPQGRDPYATPLPDESKQLGHDEDRAGQDSVDDTARSSEADSIAMTDGVRETTLGKLHETTVSPSQLLSPVSSLLLSGSKVQPTDQDTSTLVSESELRQRQNLTQTKAAAVSGRQAQENSPNDAVASTSDHRLVQDGESFLQAFFRIVFGPLSRFLGACVGDRKRAG
ncbi:hypothetical protein ACEQ8H_002813 [Pleosporales sp. CAS-2024a]